MNLREAKQFLNGKGYRLIDEATSRAVQEKVDWATAILDDFADITELTDEQYNEMKKLNPSLIKGWIGTKKAGEFFDYDEAETIANACRVWEKLNDKKQREIERYNHEKRKFESIKHLVTEVWPEFKETILSKLVKYGCKIEKKHPWTRWYEATSFFKDFPEGEKFDPDVPDKVTLSINNGIDRFYFEMPVSLDNANIGNYDALRRLGKYSNGKAKKCIELAKYQNENRNTWKIPYDIFLPAVKEFAEAQDYLNDDEIKEIKSDRASSDSFAAGATEFYRTAKNQGD